MYNRIKEHIMENALMEDIGFGDITSNVCIEEETISRAYFLIKADGIISGIDIVKSVFRLVDEKVEVDFSVNNGDKVKKGDVVGWIKGSAKTLLAGERVALNFLQHLSGIATKTFFYVSMVEGLEVKIVDTRKTTPNLRILEKEAVKHGGGVNHRFSLDDGILIKDNHIKCAGGIGKAITTVREKAPHTLKIEVEVSDLKGVKEALDYKADIIMLDNMNYEGIKEAIKLIGDRALIEASGNMGDKNIREIAEAGVNIISIGSLTNYIKSLDISMKFE